MLFIECQCLKKKESTQKFWSKDFVHKKNLSVIESYIFKEVVFFFVFLFYALYKKPIDIYCDCLYFKIYFKLC